MLIATQAGAGARPSNPLDGQFDHDPSGEDIYEDVERTLRTYALAITSGWTAKDVRVQEAYLSLRVLTNWLTFKRLALTPEQVEQYNLPTRPAKSSDPRTAKFTGKGAVEVEALPVQALLEIVENAIIDLIDTEALRVTELAERSERAVARRIAATPLERLVEATA